MLESCVWVATTFGLIGFGVGCFVGAMGLALLVGQIARGLRDDNKGGNDGMEGRESL